jgi:hypothetical protein
MRSLAAMIAEYKQNYETTWPSDVDYYSALPSIREVIDKAGRALTHDGKRHPHQSEFRRFTDALLDNWRSILLSNETLLSGSKDFAELLASVTTLKIPYIGELALYDTALRIGARLGLRPEVVYVHAGVKSGAKALKLRSTNGIISPDELPEALRALECYEVEDFLCIYKDELAGGPAVDFATCVRSGKAC